MKVQEVISNDQQSTLERLADIDNSLVPASENLFNTIKEQSNNFTIPPHKCFSADTCYEMINILNTYLYSVNARRPEHVGQTKAIIIELLNYFDPN